LQPFGGELREDEAVHFTRTPRLIRRWIDRCNRSEGPPFAIFIGDSTLRARSHLLPVFLRPWRALLHPVGEKRHLLVRQLLPLRRHLQVFIGVPDCLDEQTLLGIPGRHRRPGIAAGEYRFARIEHETAFDFLRRVAVAFVALLAEDRLDLLDEKLRAALSLHRSRENDATEQQKGGSEKGSHDTQGGTQRLSEQSGRFGRDLTVIVTGTVAGR
jgi:hypothetical protein